MTQCTNCTGDTPPTIRIVLDDQADVEDGNCSNCDCDFFNADFFLNQVSACTWEETFNSAVCGLCKISFMIEYYNSTHIKASVGIENCGTGPGAGWSGLTYGTECWHTFYYMQRIPECDPEHEDYDEYCDTCCVWPEGIHVTAIDCDVSPLCSY